ncbi:MAG: hypothetical protein UV51_C0007G0022 [Candidatus Woesebacteria bacterium GW2011_GWC1_42_9]|nr:MAG: hypothetical protein UV51_C0007G0022 [Candidatus Woesebacteria bacterium GW2011_GWC1_42_9]
MPVYLGDYPNCATDREAKFMEAVASFHRNTYGRKQLVIVSDGCEKTNAIFKKRFRNKTNMKLVELLKHELFDGKVPQAGCDAATGEILCFLDSDDILAPHHLKNIAACWTGDHDWLYFDAFYKLPQLGGRVIAFQSDFDETRLNTGTFAYRKGLDVTWAGHIGIKGNTYIIKQLMAKYPPPRCKKIYGCGYMICRGEIAKFEQKK